MSVLDWLVAAGSLLVLLPVLPLLGWCGCTTRSGDADRSGTGTWPTTDRSERDASAGARRPAD